MILELTDASGATTITGPAAGVTVSGDNITGVFQVSNGVTATISGLTIARGHNGKGGASSTSARRR